MDELVILLVTPSPEIAEKIELILRSQRISNRIEVIEDMAQAVALLTPRLHTCYDRCLVLYAGQPRLDDGSMAALCARLSPIIIVDLLADEFQGLPDFGLTIQTLHKVMQRSATMSFMLTRQAS